jgi:uncharacterized protein (DUF983 family)
MIQVTEIIATEVYTVCPHCKARNEGWFDDPRGKRDTCESCGEVYQVHPDADIEFHG